MLERSPETIASGPITPDLTTALQAEQTLLRLLRMRLTLRILMRRETPKTLSNAETHIIGGVEPLVRRLARAATAWL